MMRQMMGQQNPQAVQDMELPDTSETIHISPIALIKMLKHGRAGVPLEVMGLMLGDFIDEYTVKVVDVFAMPQSGTSVSVEAVDPVFQQQMIELVQQTGRAEMVVGWYHSHPGFGCWLSGVDVNTAKSFEQLNERAVAVVVDPIQSVNGKVVLDAFRTMNPQTVMMGGEPRQTTSNMGYLNPPSLVALVHGLNRHYYSMNVSYRTSDPEVFQLSQYKKKGWMHGFKLQDSKKLKKSNAENMKTMAKMTKLLSKRLHEEDKLTDEEKTTAFVGKVDPRKQLDKAVNEILSANVNQNLGVLIDGCVF